MNDAIITKRANYITYLQHITDLHETAKSTKSLLQSYDKAYFSVYKDNKITE